METITGRTNQHLKYARQVRKGKVPGEFFVEGKRLIDELVDSQIKTDAFYISDRFALKNDNLIKRIEGKTAVHFVSDSLFPSISDTKTPQGIAAVCRKPNDSKASIEAAIKGEGAAAVLLLHKISNPGNLGAITRSAEAFGAVGLVVSAESADPYGPVSVRGSMGSVFRLPIWRGADFRTAVEWGKRNGFTSICADARAKQDISNVDWNRRLLLVFGSEARGLFDHERELVNEDCLIPMNDAVESLNLAVAAGIVLFEAAKASRSQKD